MTKDDFNRVVNDQINKCIGILIDKAYEYADDDDRLHNFKIAALTLGVEPIHALAGMMSKHTVSIYDMCRGTSEHTHYLMSLWDEKITDHINYLLLLRAMLEEMYKLAEIT